MGHLKRTAAGVICLLGIFAAVADAQTTATLRYKWAKGDSITYRLVTQTTSRVTGMPGITEVKGDQSLTQILKITAEEVAEDGTATLRQTFVSMKMEMDGPMGHVAYDTAEPSSLANPMMQAMRQVFGGMIGESVTVVMAPDGSVRKVDGATKIIEKIAKTMQDDPQAAAAAQGLKASMNDEALKTTLEQSFSKLPPAPVKAGDAWTGTLAMGNPAIGRISGASTFTVKEIEGTPPASARIGVSLALKQEVVAPPSGPTNAVMKLGNARGEGEIIFDVVRGQIRRTTMRTEMPSTVTMDGPTGAPVTLQNQAVTTMTMELVEK